MLYVVVFDFALVGFLLAALGFFVWCWIGFRQARKPQAVDQYPSMTTVPKKKQRAEERVA
jgi:hypothetical protein